MDKNALIISALCIALMVMSGFMYSMGQEIAENNKHEDRGQMCSQYAKDQTRLNGYYSREGKFYCVYIGERLEKDINRTRMHEYAHHFVGEDPFHFCKKYKKKVCS